jgi:glycosyltransferase involved in cell wall biosynthesis
MKSITTLHQEHQGKVSDRWASYLSAYDRLFANYQPYPVSLLEIGIQNGGSLELWSKYFSQAKILVGCDINPDCSQLTYTDPRINIVVENANTDVAEQAVLAYSAQYDLIIDDGSHTSADIVQSFVRYFRHLAQGGVFVAEDLHCSYWQTFEGGLYYPYSSIAFFKRLADIINHEHWGIARERTQLLQGFAEHFAVEFDESCLADIHSIEFLNSLCVVHKRPSALNVLGERCVAGQLELVVPGHNNVRGQCSQAPAQLTNRWATLAIAPEEQWETLSAAAMARDEEIADLKAEIASLNTEITSFRKTLLERDEHIAIINYSTSWRMTKPLRLVADQLKRAIRSVKLVVPTIQRAGGVQNTLRKALRIYQNEGIHGIKRSLRQVEMSKVRHNSQPIDPVFLQKVNQQAAQCFVPRVLIIAEMSIPQCLKYRVQQKSEMFAALGVGCSIVRWNDTQACIDALQTHSLVIFYRVPAYAAVVSIIQEARRLRLPIWWEVDDFIFDKEVLANSKTLAALDKNVFDPLIEGAGLYRQAMLLCDAGIASTTGLADAMQRAGVPAVWVIENALDQATLDVAATVCREYPLQQTDCVRIVYGSGTNTHNIDFAEAAPALLAILSKFPQVRFRLIGTLALPEGFARYANQVEIIPFCDYAAYLGYMAECDISIAPLENYVFNDSKSNIKYLEASIVKLPSVCSPRAAFTQVMLHGENGFLCETPEEWEVALTQLVTDAAKRVQVGAAAYATVMQRYSPNSIATQQVAPLLDAYKRNPAKLRILSVNCYYYPRSFGGATIVAEAVNQWINEQSDCDVHVFTTVPASVTPPYTLRRYEAQGINVYGVGIPDILDAKTQFDNPHMVAAFADVLAVVQPDIVHFHSIQTIGVAVVDLCIQQDIHYAVTLHDAWWLCGRQFMINQQGKYCEQETIDRNVCARCVDNQHLNRYRDERLRHVLHNAALLLSPSHFFADFYKVNGFATVQVNKNGIVKPHNTARIRREGALRFGYVGGNTEIKGFHLIKKVFAELGHVNVKLVLVDNAVNLGFTSYHPQDLAGIPNVEVVPAYTQHNIDAFFSSIDVLLFPTQWKESFGLSVREALARNVWVIATDAGGVVEDICVGENGYIIPFADKDDGLQQAVLNTLEYFERIPFGEAITLNATNIRFFAEQAEELVDLLKSVAKR